MLFLIIILIFFSYNIINVNVCLFVTLSYKNYLTDHGCFYYIIITVALWFKLNFYGDIQLYKWYSKVVHNKYFW